MDKLSKSPAAISQYLSLALGLIVYLTSCFSFLNASCDGWEGAPGTLALNILFIIFICASLARFIKWQSHRLGYAENENEKKISFFDWLFFYISALYIIFWVIDKLKGNYNLITMPDRLLGPWALLLLALFVYLLINSLRRFKKRYFSLKKTDAQTQP
jgi:TRAP-type uncharacterized transport system fused permease subunit